MQRGIVYGLAILCLGCFSVSRAGNLEKKMQRLIEKLKTDLKDDCSSIRDEVANLRDDVSNLRDGECADRDNIFELKESLVELRDLLKELPCDNNVSEQSATEDCNRQSDGVQRILPKIGKPFLARCEAGWLIIGHRYDGSVDFNKVWESYKLGFGKVWKEHFIGFENILSVLQQKEYKARFDLTTWENETKYAEYQIFDFNDRKDKYRISIGGYNGTAGDAMQDANHNQFSTKDSRNDNFGGSCILSFGGPYWYGACLGAGGSIFGMYSKSPKCPSISSCLTWQEWPKKLPGVDHNGDYSFKEVKFKIRPI
ncbi:unnamed protein product [Owenia fusiformis]|uniref:Uncharacterized protein n=1 Tax=Owenia fusiformis TaxID=6347 RepID=A0A8J1Y0A1_OWEFU|nr:unnamed protein product [Owenia fusiformis]